MKNIIIGTFLTMVFLASIAVSNGAADKSREKLDKFLAACTEENKKGAAEQKQKKYFTVSYENGFYFLDSGSKDIPKIRLKKNPQEMLKNICPEALKQYKNSIPE